MGLQLSLMVGWKRYLEYWPELIIFLCKVVGVMDFSGSNLCSINFSGTFTLLLDRLSPNLMVVLLSI